MNDHNQANLFGMLLPLIGDSSIVIIEDNFKATIFPAKNFPYFYILNKEKYSCMTFILFYFYLIFFAKDITFVIYGSFIGKIRILLLCF